MHDFTNTFTTQEGAIFDMAYAKCPRCSNKSELSHWRPHSMVSFLCPDCGLMYDEPTFEPGEAAYLGVVDDDKMTVSDNHYVVTWEIDCWANNPEDAAREALIIQRDADSKANCFRVKNMSTGESAHVDLFEDDGRNGE